MSPDQTVPSPSWEHGSSQAGPPSDAAGPYGPGHPGPPPGPSVPYGYGPAPRSLAGIAIAACILLGIAGLVCLGSAGTLFSRADAAAAAADGDVGAFRVLPQRDDSVALGTGLYALSVLLTGPLVIMWQHRHASNAQRLSGPLGLGPGWAIGGWFIPLGNMVLPTVQVAQAGRASDPDLVAGPPGTRSRGRIPSITIVWGVAWALGGLLFSLGAVMRPTEDSPVRSADAALTDFAAADRTAGVGMLVLAAAAVLAIVMIRSLTARQARAEAVRPPFAGTAGPWAVGQPGDWADRAGWVVPANPWSPPPAAGGHPGHGAPPPPQPSGPGGPPRPPPPPPPPPRPSGPGARPPPPPPPPPRPSGPGAPPPSPRQPSGPGGPPPPPPDPPPEAWGPPR